MLWLVIMKRQKKDRTGVIPAILNWTKWNTKSSSSLRNMEKILERFKGSSRKPTKFLSVLFILHVNKQYMYQADCYTLGTQNNFMHPHVHKTWLQQHMALALLNTVNMERVPLELGPSTNVCFSLQDTPIKPRSYCRYYWSSIYSCSL